MKAIKSADGITLHDQRVAVCGDWHGSTGWARVIAGTLPVLAPDVTTILHLGDWWMKSHLVDEIFADTSIERIYVTLGNHEQWNQTTRILGKHPGPLFACPRSAGCSRALHG
ncbi:metallophosphoesterase [Microbacterium sp. M]|uniref:metallophosphoesterase n=1 Tax=Microbacterium sp. M TaxID=3377125 RepID=UPI00387090E1